MLPVMFSQGISRDASSLEEEFRCDPKRSKKWPMLLSSSEPSSSVRNHWKCTCCEGNELSSRTSSDHPKKMRSRMPRTQFPRPGVKSCPPTVSSFCFVLLIGHLIFGARTPRTSTNTSGMLSDTFSQGIVRDAARWREN